MIESVNRQRKKESAFSGPRRAESKRPRAQPARFASSRHNFFSATYVYPSLLVLLVLLSLVISHCDQKSPSL